MTANHCKCLVVPVFPDGGKSAYFDALDSLNERDAEREQRHAELEQLRRDLGALRRSHDEWANLAELLVTRIDELTSHDAAAGVVTP
ncbi:hypothetical protein [Mycolicibacterium wolinskyi]|uniref:hypothetical protein n=1 Tax=Mycolicibacterium wolinskyi TaxID=59750 RepID=UPI003917A46E